MREHTLHALHSRYTSSAKYDTKHMFSYLDFRYYFEANGQNHIHFRLVQVLKNSMAGHFLTFRSLSSKLEVVYPPWSKSKFSSFRQLTIVLIWKTPAYLFATRKTLSLSSERFTLSISDEFDPTELRQTRASKTIDLRTLEFGYD